MDQVRGEVDRVRYASEDTGWGIINFIGDSGPFTAVGEIAGLRPGEQAELTGAWTVDPKWGRQFKVTDCRITLPSSILGVERYLASLPGIGPGFARRLTTAFGAEAIKVAQERPESLLEIDGVGEERAKAIHEEVSRHASTAFVYAEMQSLGVPARFFPAILRRWHGDALDEIRSNPYSLMDIDGIGWKTADEVARRAGIPLGDIRRVRAAILHCLGQAVGEGHCYLTQALLNQRSCKLLGLTADCIPEALAALEEDDRITLDEGAIYPRWIWATENNVAAHLARLIARPAERAMGEPSTDGITLDAAQSAAVQAALESKVLVVTGGPGTGKTTITKVILSATAGLSVALGAPTGRAAKRLHQATGRPAKTIHRLLEYHPAQGWRRNRYNPLDADLVLIDEVSMVDIALLAHLVEALPDRCRLILVGDADQLPSVGPGAVLRDLIESRQVPVVRLQNIYRQESGRSLITANSHRVIRGLELDLEDGVPTDERDLWLVRRANENVVEAILEMVADRIPKRYGLDPMRDIWVLSPMRMGPLGVKALNEALQDRLNPHGAVAGRFRLGDRVMQTRNNYDLGVFNGDAGIVKGWDDREKILEVEIDGYVVRYAREHQGDLVLAYASTVHKAQGGEFPAAILVMSTSHYIMLRRRLFYTGMTRARRLAVIVGQEAAINTAISDRVQELERFTGLAGRIVAACEGKLEAPAVEAPARDDDFDGIEEEYGWNGK